MLLMEWVTAIAFTILSILSIVFAIRKPGAIAFWATAAFLSITIILDASVVRPDARDSAFFSIFTIVLVALLAVFPWALFRFAETVSRRRHKAVRWIADIAFAALFVPVFFINWSTFNTATGWFRTVYTLAFLTYLCLMPLVAGIKLLFASRGQSAVVAKRLRIIAIASLLIGVGIIIQFTRVGNSANDGVRIATYVLLLISAVMYVVALSAPQALRRYWNLANESAINEAVGDVITFSSADESIQRLLPPIAQACGSHTAAFFATDGSTRAVLGLTPEEAIARRASEDNEQQSIAVTLTSGTIVIWTDALWPFPADDEQQLLANVGGILDLLVSRRDAEEMRHQLEIRTRVEQSLREQAGELERVNAELNQFVAVASHDLQAPMRNILDYVDFLRQDIGTDLSPNAEEDLHFISTAAARMRELIEALLSYTRVGSAAVPLTQHVNIGDIVHTALQTLNIQISGVGGTVEVGELPTIQGDPTTLNQLFVNLIENCVKYRCPDRPLEVQIWATPHQDSCTYFVQDNGEGVPPEFQTRIFTMFKRLHTDDDIPGTGIGLAICQRIVERHGGTIWVQESDNDGTTICFTLQNRHDSRDEHPPPAAAVPHVRQADHLVG